MSIISPKSGLSPEGSPEVRYHKSMVENRRTCEKGSRWAENEKGKELKTAKKMMMMYMNCREWNAHGGHVENIIRCDHPSCIPVGPFVSELWHFKYFPTWRPSAILNLKKKLIFNHMTVVAVLICCCVQNFNKIGSRVRPPDVHNCWMYNAPFLGNGRCHGNRITDDMLGTWRDARPPKFHPNRSIDRRVVRFPTFCNMAVVRHLEYEFCYSGPPTKSTMRFNYHVQIWYRSDISCRRYYDFIILPLWLENA